ncbi:MAG: hypothetical protein Q8R43_00440 [Alphaproteobacteria bacterium]|nr:hypothetical protein [Alphaproteobacteria bacterium]
MSSWTLIITAMGSLGWLLLLREGLQRWSQNGLNNGSADQEFQINYCAKPLGRLRLVTLEWQGTIYCIAVDIQGSYVQVIDKHPIKRATS